MGMMGGWIEVETQLSIGIKLIIGSLLDAQQHFGNGESIGYHAYLRPNISDLKLGFKTLILKTPFNPIKP
jgi:hypothetical protein